MVKPCNHNWAKLDETLLTFEDTYALLTTYGCTKCKIQQEQRKATTLEEYAKYIVQ